MISTVPTLRTERLTLRAFTAADVDAFAALNADPEVARFLHPDGQPLSPDDSWRQLALLLGHWQLRGYGMWAVAESERPDVLIGRVGAHHPAGWPGFEIGWVFARQFWSRGYATESAAAAVRDAFDVLDQPRIISLIHPDNTRSRAVAERVGERRMGELTLRGQRVEVYGLERDAWLVAHSNKLISS